MMRTGRMMVACAAIGFGALAARAAAEKPDWENPAVNSRNRLPARTYAMPLASEAAALTDALEPETPYVQSLNGKWKFSWAGNPDLRAKDFWRADFNDADWFEIDVPSCVEMKGFGSPGYTNVRYPHANESQPTNEHFATIRDRKTGKPDYNPVSSYRTRFTVPANWKGRDVILRFDGVYSAYNVWLNGQKVGYAEDSKLPSEFDITPFLKDENLLCVEVFRWCDGSYFEDQDMFRFSGIFRDVTLWAKPKDGIEDFIVRTRLVNGYESWCVELELEKGGSATLYDAAFKKVGDLKPLSNSKLQLQLSPRLWSAEDPYLYTLVIKKGEDIRMKRVGFKEQKIVGNRFLVNGKPLKLHGVNRHEHSPANGRAVTREEMITDVTMMKRANIDTVRTSHYPNHRFFYDLCDRYGLYVVAEANVEGHEPGYAEKGLGRMPAWEHTIVERNLRHVAFYRNNPCVTLWSMGNETGHGDNFRHALAAVKALDPSRPTHWERGNPDADVDSRMYPWVYWLEERGKLADLPAGTPYSKAAWGQIGKSEGQSAGKPMMLCEYAHAMGNAIGNLEDYWKLFYRYDGLMGGCIWDWIDQAVWKETGRIDPKTGLAERYLAYGGDFDEEPNDGPFCCNGVIDAERHVTAKLVEVAHVYRPLAVTKTVDGFEIWNHALFTSANAYDGTWELLEDGVAVRHGTFAVPSVAPLAHGTFAIPELADFAFDPAKEYFVNFAFATRRDTLWAKKGFVLARDQVALAKVKGKGEGEQWWKNHTLVRPSPASSLSVAQDDKTVTVTAGGTKAVFCRATGTLCALEMDGVSVLGAATLDAVPGPQLTCMRAFVDNDQWLQAGCLASGLTQLRYHARPIVVEANRVRTSVEVTGSKSAGFTHTSEWTFAADGSLTIANHVEPHGTMPIPTVYDNGYQNFEGKGYLPRLGLSFRLAPALEQVAYYGRGPRENYIDRKTASFVGLWKSTVTDLAENYVRPQDNGMRTDVRWASFTDAQGRGVRFEMSEPIFLQALHCDREDLQYARHQNRQRRHITPVPVRPDVYLNLDLRQTGLGGNSCGPEPMNEGLYTARPESWTVRMSPASATAAAKASAAAERPLPGEPCTKLPVPPAPFPDRLSAFVWRNWGLVPVETLAQTVGATSADLNAIAADMGLKANPVVLPEWKTKGYITVLRRNWHLLPYEQLLTVLGKTRDELYFSLMEDDFLWYKLGRIKPKCERLVYDKAEVEKSRAGRLRIAQILKEEGLDPNAPEEPRFAFIKEIAAPSPNLPLSTLNTQPSTSPFDFRLIFSYFADYGDPLADPEIGSFPEGLLQKLAAQGVNAVWLHTVLRTLAKDPKYPEFGAGSEKRIANLRTLVARAKKYGIRVFLYMNEPRAQPASFFAAQPWRASMKGSTDGDQFAMCTASPETRRWLSDSLEQVFRSVPGLGGIFTITMSENLTHCDARWEKKLCPRCKARPTSDLVVETNRAMIEGMLRGNPDAEAILYSWAWPEDEIETIMAGLPKKGCRVMCVSEHGMKIRRGGVDATESDYAISIVGPGEEATKVWNLARAEGIPCVAKVQAANSWEISTFPYIPTMDLVAQHASNLANAGVNGVMLSWSLGCCPSPNLAFYRDLEKGEKTPEGVLNRMAERLYGKANVAQVRRAWKAFSDGFVNYPFACQTIYNGPQQWGPANPLYWQKTDWAATMVGIPYDDLKGWRAQYPGETYAALMQKVADGFAEGCRLLEGIAPAKELAMFRAEQMHFASCADQTRFVLARDAGDKDGMRRAAQAELARAKAYWPLVRADSRIGYESSNHYFFIPRDVLEKVLSCRATP